jgi:penicillin amidase
MWNRIFRTICALAVLAAATLSLPIHADELAVSTQILDVNGEEVRIERDFYGVPRIIAETNHGLFAGLGYAVAEDRLWQLEVNRRAGRGRLAEILGPVPYLAMDRNTRRLGYTDAELDQMFAALSPEEQEIAAAYADGVNLYLSEVVTPDPANKLPFEFHYLSIGVPAPLTIRDLVAFNSLTSRNLLENGDQERTAQTLLSNLVTLHGPTNGFAIFNDVQWLFDPDSPASIPVVGANGKRPHPSPPPPPAGQLQGAADPMDADSDTDAQDILEAVGVPTKLGSHAWVVGPQWSTNGRAMLFGGPQASPATAPTVVPPQAPPQMFEVELNGGNGFHVRGMTYPGLLRVIQGRNDFVAWSFTAALASNNVDTYIETVCGGGTGYSYQGNCVPFETRTEVINVRGAASEILTVERTVHGPVVASGPGVRYSQKSVVRNRELENASAFLDINRAHNVQQFDQAIHRLVGSLNAVCADRSGNIGYWRSGLMPVRPSGFDVRLPLPGDGSAEWTGVEQTVPSSINPVRGWLTSWNNRATVDEEISERVDVGGKQQRVLDIEDRLRAGPISLADLKDIESDIARIGKDRMIGRMSRYLRPYLLQALDAVPSAHPLAAQAEAVVNAWDGNRYADAVASTTRQAGEVIFSTWLDLMLPATFGDELGADVGRAIPNMLIHVLDDALGGGSGVPPSRDYFNGQDPRAVMSSVFTLALNSLGPDPAAWSSKPRDIVRFRHVLYPAVPELGSMFDSDRDTYAQFVAFTNPVQAGNIFVLGQSGFIQLGPGGTPVVSPNFTSLLDLYRGFQYKPMPITHRAAPSPYGAPEEDPDLQPPDGTTPIVGSISFVPLSP